MWSLARTQVLFLPLLLIACKKAEVGPGSCPAGASQIDGICRNTCTGDSDCLLSEFCDPAPDVCLPEPITGMPKVKVFEVDPVPVAMGGSVNVDFAVVSADRLRLSVEWAGGGVEQLLDSSSEYFGTEVIAGVSQNGVVRLIATKNGVDQEHERTIELDDGQPRLVDFSIDQNRVPVGTSVRVSWEVVNANAPIQIAIEGGEILQSDAAEKDQLDFVIVGATAFTLSSGELFAREQVDVITPNGPEFVSFQVLGSKPSVHDQPVTLIWETKNAVEVGLEINGNATGYTTRSPAEVDHGALVVILPAGSHSLRMTATGAGQEKASSDTRTVVFVSDKPPTLATFEYPEFLEEASGGGLLTLRWRFDAPDPDQTVAMLAFTDQAAAVVDLDSEVTRPIPSQTITATLRAESLAGVSEATATMFRVRGEVEPNEEFLTAQDTDGFAIDGVVSTGDLDFFRVATLNAGQTLLASLHGGCPTGITLVITDENFMMRSVTAQFDGDCPSISYESTGNDRLYVNVETIDLMAGFLTAYRMTAEIIDPVCGDGLVDPNLEQCDIGDRLNGDGCSADCIDEDYLFYGAGNDVVINLEERPSDARLLDLHQYPNNPRPGEGFAMLPIGFEFPFYERSYFGLVVHSNGFISFLPDFLPGGFEPAFPLELGPPNAVIAALGADLRAGGQAGDGIYTWNTGDGGRAVEFAGMILVGHPNSRLTARIVVHPDGRILIGYPSLSGLNTEASFVAGVQDRNGGRTFDLPGCEQRCTSDVFPTLDGSGYELMTLGIR